MNKPVQPMSSLSLRPADARIAARDLPARRVADVSGQAATARSNRVAFSAAHVVADPLADVDPWLDAAIDWDATHRLSRASLGPRARRRRSDGHRAARHGARLADLARADPPLGRGRARRAATRWCSPAPAPIISSSDDAKTVDDVIRAYEEQMAAIEKVGGRIILMARRALAASAAAPTTTRRSTTACCRRSRSR